MERIRGVVFDFDGVLADTERLQYEKWNLVLKKFGVRISKEEYIRDYVGKSSKNEIPKLLKEKYEIPISEEELYSESQKFLKTLFEKKARIIPFALKALKKISKRYKIAIASGESDKQLSMKLKSVKLENYFPPEVRSTEERAGRGKPYPDMYILAAKLIGLSPKNCLAFEDTEKGVIAAKNAGLYVIALPNDFTIGQDFSKADRVVFGGWKEFLRDPYPLEI
ncbi:MAG: HAD family phosphatase [Candidatus Aenigmatarchaeota archaeon]